MRVARLGVRLVSGQTGVRRPEDCEGKRQYMTKALAKKALKRHRGNSKMHIYRCPFETRTDGKPIFHIGLKPTGRHKYSWEE